MAFADILKTRNKAPKKKVINRRDLATKETSCSGIYLFDVNRAMKPTLGFSVQIFAGPVDFSSCGRVKFLIP